ncbi:hypothetical protein [Spirochaeta africana]|uniref:PBS lyase HEAT-like repeat protein n=1 Tax=Spirochaeta africana (strain ATCC 700263 / DSM 8902 / Z-7692) TaxID=889378 RepID=H9UL51_SPIAZ|nr:hypothetical protein [Spirochaeta africana]AFG38244.1 hypothetical protein Spiaf_2208 [Spirochaeta africana DSM 8902]
MKRTATLVLLSVFLTVTLPLAAQNSLADNYIRDFRAAEGQVRMQILESSLENDPAEMEDLYITVIEHVVSTAGDRITDAATRNMYQLAVAQLVQVGSNRPALRVWELFELDRDTSQRLRLLEALQVLGQDAPRLYSRLANWVMTQNSLARSGSGIDRQVLGEAIQTIASFNDPVFFEALLDTVVYGHPSAIEDPAREAIRAFGDQQADLLQELIPGQPLERQLEQLSYVRRRDDLGQQQQAEIAAAVLRRAVDRQVSTTGDAVLNRRIRNDAAAMIRAAGYAGASPQVIEHFNVVAVDYENRRVSQADLLDAIDTLASVGTQNAAVRLTRYLDFLNTQTQNDRPVSTQIMLATVNGLRDLGHAESYSSLFYATMLNYPSRVQTALQDAIEAVQQ